MKETAATINVYLHYSGSFKDLAPINCKRQNWKISNIEGNLAI